LSYVETTSPYYQQAIDEICNLNWTKLTEEDIIRVAWAYYHFSVQFRECLEIARKMYPDDERLLQLDHGERSTDNLSPWPGVAATGENESRRVHAQDARTRKNPGDRTNCSLRYWQEVSESSSSNRS
jgi:hypothetical protein